jgi:dienelactone hydrolase
MIVKRTLFALSFILAALVGASAAKAWDDTPRLRINYLAFPVQWGGKTVTLGSRFQVPLNANGKVPAVIMLHNGSGISYRGVYYAAALNSAGIATLEIDQYGGRRLAGGGAKPIELLSDIGDAHHLLAERAEIGPERIGLTGMSFGGIETVLMMTRRNSDAVLGPGRHLQAAVALYPVCFRYNHAPGFELANMVDAPLRIFVGTEDELDDGQGACETLMRDLAPDDAAHLSLRVFTNATHAFDGFDGAAEVNDPLAHHGKGGVMHIRPNPEAREQARSDLVQFFAAALKAK